MTQERNRTFWIWTGALLCFVLAAATGALYRFGFLYGLPAGLSFGNVRHAHSHLMFLGWVTPLLMGLIIHWWPAVTGRPLGRRRGLMITIAALFLLALLAYPAFLLYGYQAAEIGGRRLPLSSLILGVTILVWYAFITLYWLGTRGQPRPLPVRLWDAALAFLFLASLGAWGAAFFPRIGLTEPFWSLAATQLFLDAFGEGWFVLGTLAVLYATFPDLNRHPLVNHPHMEWANAALFIGLPFVFLLQMPSDLVPSAARLLASGAGLLVMGGTGVHLAVLGPAVTPLYRLPLAFLALKTAGLVVILLPAGAEWVAGAGLKISYLHWLLLGFVSAALILTAGRSWEGALDERTMGLFLAAFVLMMATLLTLTGLWPRGWSGRWLLHLVAWTTLPPIAISLVWLWRSRARFSRSARSATAAGSRAL